MTDAVRIVILGASGRMGRELARLALDDERLSLVGAVADRGLGGTLGELHGLPGADVRVVESLDAVESGFDVVVDFSAPAATLAALPVCEAAGAALVTGTSGLDEAQQQTLVDVSARVAICQAANFSIGVNVCLELLATAARMLGPDYDAEVIEAHHRHKVDAPSGTALALGQAVAAARGLELPGDGVFARHGQTGERPAGSIGFSTIRGGDIVGEHTVLFAGDGERVEISHKASNRGNFAAGALQAARWLKGRGPGLYGMRDVLAGAGQ